MAKDKDIELMNKRKFNDVEVGQNLTVLGTSAFTGAVTAAGAVTISGVLTSNEIVLPTSSITAGSIIGTVLGSFVNVTLPAAGSVSAPGTMSGGAVYATTLGSFASIRIGSNASPGSTLAVSNAGDIRYDGTYLYIGVATGAAGAGSWLRGSFGTW